MLPRRGHILNRREELKLGLLAPSGYESEKAMASRGGERRPALGSQSSPASPVDDQSQQQLLRELERELLEDEEGDGGGEAKSHRLEQLLLGCAGAMARGELGYACELLERLNQVVSILGDPMQRLAAYMKEGLVARLQSSGRSLYDALKCSEPRKIAASASLGEILSAMQLLYEACPYFKFGFVAANGVISEALLGEPSVHILDWEISPMATQWLALLEMLAARPGGPPSSIRLTAGGPAAASAGTRLVAAAEAGGLNLAFEVLPPEDDELRTVTRHPSETMVVNFTMSLHHISGRRRDTVLAAVRRLSPRLVALVEQEADTDEQPFLPRFVEALRYYAAIFESLDEALPRSSRARVGVEQLCLARDIVNIIACEGDDRVERHQRSAAWASRLVAAGFEPRPLSVVVSAAIASLLAPYSSKYRFDLVDSGCFLRLGWLEKVLVVASCWSPSPSVQALTVDFSVNPLTLSQ